MLLKETILIVDDEEDILELIGFHLKNEGYKLLTAGSGEQAIKIARQSCPDLIVLDLMLPGMDGLEVTRCLRNNPDTRNMPIVMLTAKGEETDIVTGLEMGANDYISKPFSPKVLLARIRAILRRRRKDADISQSSLNQGSLNHEKLNQEGELIIDKARHRVTLEENELYLTPSEFALLAFLTEHKGWVFTRGQIVDAIRGENYAVTERSIDVVMVGLRRKLKHYARNIETVRGVGYRFKEPH